MKGQLLHTKRAKGKSFQPNLEALEGRQLLSGFQLLLSQPGFDPLTISDNGPGDSSPEAGVITYIGSYGTFPVNVVTGISSGGTASEPSLLLSSINVAGPEGGALRILLADDNFLVPSDGGQPLRFRSDSGGTMSGAGTIGLQGWMDTSNQNNAAGLGMGEHGPYPGSAFSDTHSGSVASPAAPFSLVNEVNIAFQGAGVTGFSMYSTIEALQSVDEPAINPDPGLFLGE